MSTKSLDKKISALRAILFLMRAAARTRPPFVSPKGGKSICSKQTDPGAAGISLRYSHPAALMSRCAPTFAFSGGLLRCSAA
jgi:hypothetical protein